MKTKLKAAVDEEDYAEAAKCQAKLKKLGEEIEALKKARIAAGGKEVELAHADEMEAIADEQWDADIAENLKPLDAALASTIAIVQQSVEMAASMGNKKIGIGPASAISIAGSRRQRRPRVAGIEVTEC